MKIDASGWKEFRVGDLFSVSRPDSRSQTRYFDGVVPFVATSSFNNGITGYYEPINNERLDRGNCITVSPLNGYAFYQPLDFLGRGGAGSAILMLRNDALQEYSGLFIATVIRQTLTKYSYNDQINTNSIKEEIIKLPITSSGKPDWNFMEQYMKHVLAKAELDLDCLTKILINPDD